MCGKMTFIIFLSCYLRWASSIAMITALQKVLAIGLDVI